MNPPAPPETTMKFPATLTRRPTFRADLADVEGAEQIGTCKVCGRPTYTVPGLRGGRPDYCRPDYQRKRVKGRTVYVREQRSKCATIAKRTDELRRMASDLAVEIENDPMLDIEHACAAGQALKGYVWSEMNSATNVFGRLVRRLRKK